MSRIGRLPITIPAGVEIMSEGNVITVKGKLGTLSQKIASKNITWEVKDNAITFARLQETKDVKAMHGLYRTLVSNMVKGVTEGFSKKLLLNGVGYKAQVSGNKLTMSLGLSHPVEMIAPEGITFASAAATEVTVSGISKEQVGAVAANIRAARPIEPYHGYGIRYSTEAVVLKEGKTAGK